MTTAAAAPFFSTKTDQFTYFALQLGEMDWRGKNVLDFGGNIGNMLKDPNSTIDHERYWCIDVIQESVETGRARYPKAHWIHYDRRSFSFNPYGASGLPLPDPGCRFDYIVAYSVFSNTMRTDMLELVPQLEGMLAGHGALAFTFIDPRHVAWPKEYRGDNFRWRLERENGDLSTPAMQELLDRARPAKWCILVNGDDLYIETDDIRPYEPALQRSSHVFYTTESIQSLFPHATIQPPANGEMQHCCVIRRQDRSA